MNRYAKKIPITDRIQGVESIPLKVILMYASLCTLWVIVFVTLSDLSVINDNQIQLYSIFVMVLSGVVLYFFTEKRLRRVRRMVDYDPLTLLPNKAQFERSLFACIQKHTKMGTKGAFLLFGLDNFKTINESFGYTFGDKILRNVADFLKVYMQDEAYVAYFGGDEFAVVIQEPQDSAAVEAVADSIIQAFNKPWFFDDRELFITVSAGIVFFPDGGDDVQSLIMKVDTALHSAKDSGKNRYQLYMPEMNEAFLERLNIEGSLRRALEQQEFTLYYQPQIDLLTGRMIGVEALIRWNNPEQGMVSPLKFIPVAEETGLIIPIGDWVIEEACRQKSQWNAICANDMIVSVNFSARQMFKPDIIGFILRTMEEYGIQPRELCIEVTESLAMKNVEQASMILRELHELGIKISLDDFGTGYSSLNYLKLLSISNLKIDKSFIDNITVNAYEKAIVETVIELAHKIGLTVTAEGVEDEAQQECLRSYNCDILQGYLISRPVPPDEINRMILNAGKHFCSL